MSEPSANPQQPFDAAPRWQPLSAIERRVVGVLAEKAKTTPDAYPMSLNAVCTGCNQKSNRDPLMQLEPDDVEQSLDRLREIGAVGLVEGYGRVAKYRHYLYEWLGVDKVELAVMTELLLRGDQTVGELRGRAARMEPIADLNALRGLLDSLKSKGLMVSLTPEGRGQVVTHALYKPRELEALHAKYAGVRPAEPSDEEAASSATARQKPAESYAPSPAGGAPVGGSVSAPSNAAAMALLRRDLDELRQQVAQLKDTLDDSLTEQQRLSEELRLLKDALGG
jgi:uncharacterized protein